MSSEIDEQLNNKSTEELFAKVNDIAKSSDESFLKHLTDIVESEEYIDAVDALVENASETSIQDIIDSNISEMASEETDNGILDTVSESDVSSDNVNPEGPDDNNEDSSNEDEKEKKPISKGEKAFWITFRLICIGVIIYCVYRIGNYAYTHYTYKRDMGKLQDEVGSIVHEYVPPVQTVVDIFFPDEVVYASNKVEFENIISDSWATTYRNLVEINPDCIGWIQIPDSEINYPVMFAPDTVDKYLHLNFNQEWEFRGLPYLDERTVINVSPNYIVYGHNMNDGTAFGHLCDYLNDDFCDNNKYCYFNTPYGECIYQLMDVVVTKIYTVEDDCFKYYKYAGDLTEEEFNTYTYYMDKMSRYESGITASWGDEILSLSTCYKAYDEDGRLVVVWKRVQ